jgi:glycosyltransferase involved in cell wall biosynthesis
MCDELILSEDGNRSKALEEIVDIYLPHQRMGHGNNLKTGWEASTKNYVAFIDSDIRITEGSLRDLCVPDTLVYPTWANWSEYRYPQTGKELWQWFVVAPKEFFQECPPYPNPTRNHPEGLDEWGDEIRERFPILHSDKLTYWHQGGTTYAVF